MDPFHFFGGSVNIIMQVINHVDILANACKGTIEQMTRFKVKNVNVAKAEERSEKLPFAHIISYVDSDEKVDGNFILSFENNDAALNLASAIAKRLGIGAFEEICEDSTDLLNEFLNVVVGRTISEWDNIGLSVKFGTPVFKKDYKNENSKHLQAYMIILDVAAEPAAPEESRVDDHIVLMSGFFQQG